MPVKPAFILQDSVECQEKVNQLYEMAINFHDSDCATGEKMFNTAQGILDRQAKFRMELVHNKRFAKWVLEDFGSANAPSMP